MSPFDVYRTYIALKAHFTSPSYDIFKYRGKSSATRESFDSRRDRSFFYVLSNHPDPTGFLLSNFLASETFWIGDCTFNEEAVSVYREWKKRTQSLRHYFTMDLKRLPGSFSETFDITPENAHPLFVRAYFQGKISLETLVYLLDLSRREDEYQESLTDLPFQKLHFLVKKYRPFLPTQVHSKIREAFDFKYTQSLPLAGIIHFNTDRDGSSLDK